MRCEFYTYNTSPVRYQAPTFMAKPIKVNWNSESGQKIEKILAWMGAAAAASISYYKNNPNTDVLDDEEKKVMDEYLDFDEKSAIATSKAILTAHYNFTKDENIMDKHHQLFVDAYKNRNLLRGSYTDFGDYELAYYLMNSNVVEALNLLGKGVLESAFSLDFQGFDNFCTNINDLQLSISKPNLELLKKKINPESSEEYKNLEEAVRKNKRKIGRLLGKENSIKRKELLAQIENLKGDKNNAKEIKELKKQVQDLYKNCENSSDISDLMKEINELQRQKKELVSKKVNLSPQEIINKVWTIAAISQSPNYNTDEIILPEDYFAEKVDLIKAEGTPKDDKFVVDKDKVYDILGEDSQYYVGKNKRKLNKDIKELINLIQPSSPENDKAWKNNINKKLYEYAELRYNEKFADTIDLANCKYLNELIISDRDFWNEMQALLYGLATYHLNFPNESNSDALESFLHNIETRERFTAKGINYDKWIQNDESSYIENAVTIRAEDAKQKAVKNMCDELTSSMFKNIPQKERKSLYRALKEIGVSVNKNHVKMNGNDIQFEDLEPIMSIIKTELNDNTFWQNENSDETVEKARDTLYCHFMLQRKQEIDCAKRLRESETLDVKVQKVDMSNIKHSIGLGNDSHCCTALGSQSNEWSAPAYIVNRCIGAIEVLANGEAVGNTMIYLADIDNGTEKHIALVLDDIELQTKYQNNEKIRDMIIEYGKKLCSEIGKPDIPIYAGPGMHKVDISTYPLIKTNMEIIGKSPENGGVYLDFDGDIHDIGDIIEKTDLYKIA